MRDLNECKNRSEQRRKGCERRTNGQESFVGGIYIDIDFEKSGEQTGKRARTENGGEAAVKKRGR